MHSPRTEVLPAEAACVDSFRPTQDGTSRRVGKNLASASADLVTEGQAWSSGTLADGRLTGNTVSYEVSD